MGGQARGRGGRHAWFGSRLAALVFPCVVAGIAQVLVGCSDVGDSTALPGENPGASTSAAPDANESFESTDAASSAANGGSATSDGSTGSSATMSAADATIADATTDGNAGSEVDVFAQGDATSAADSGVEETSGSNDAASDAAADSTVADAASRDAEEADAREDAAPADSGAEIDAAVDSGTRSDAAPEDAAARDAGAADAAEAGHVLVPCTSAGQTDCVNCLPYNSSGLCTATEAQFVQVDIDAGLVTAAGQDSAQGCYACLVNAGCLDDNEFGDMGHECGDAPGATTSDLPATFTNGSGVSVDSTSTCLATIDCIVSTGCGTAANGGLTNCYCGTEGGGPSACATATAVNGECETQEVAGFSHTDPNDIVNKDYTDTLEPSGMANQIFSCGKEMCLQCLQ